MKQTEQPACWKCRHMKMEPRNCGQNSFYCLHPDAHTETMPHRRIAQSRGEVIPIKTAPRWCPLKQQQKKNEED